jgi:hypothetical protein
MNKKQYSKKQQKILKEGIRIIKISEKISLHLKNTKLKTSYEKNYF